MNLLAGLNDLFLAVITLVKKITAKSGRNGRFRHETPKVVPQILTCLKYVRFQRCRINQIFSVLKYGETRRKRLAQC